MRRSQAGCPETRCPPIHLRSVTTAYSLLRLCTRLFAFLRPSIRSSVVLIPAQRAARLVLDDPRLEEVALLLQVDHLAHPRERVARPRVQRVEADLLAAAVGDEAQVLLEHRRVEPEHAARHGVLRVAVLELDRLAEEIVHLLAELAGPE